LSEVQQFDVVVVGGGIAGLTAGLFSARLGRATLVLVPLMPGGQLATIAQIEDFPGFAQGVAGYELGPMVQEQAAAAGAEFQMCELQSITVAEGGWRIVTSEAQVRATAVIIASGSASRALGVPGEARLTGKGVSHCASCDGPMLKNKKVIVVGAGDSALQEALTLADFADEVLVLHRSAIPTGQETYLRRVREQSRIRLQHNSFLEAILGESVVTGVCVSEHGVTSEIAADAVFVYIGLQPNSGFLQGIADLDDEGRVRTDLDEDQRAGSIRCRRRACRFRSAGRHRSWRRRHCRDGGTPLSE
jgi:thioredoxin reductase (NADPH)